MLRITHLVRRFHPLRGGTERYALDLAARQAVDGHRVEILTLDRDILGYRSPRLPRHELANGVRIERLPGWGGRRWALTRRPDRLVSHLARADVIHLHDLRFQFALAHLVAAARRRPLFVHTHGLFFHTLELERLKRLALRGFYGPIARAGHSTIVASSRTDRDRLIDAVPSLAGATHVIANGIDLSHVRGLRRAPADGLLLSFGRLTESKGLREAIDALALLGSREWRLVVAGEAQGDELDVLARRATEAGISDRLTFPGPVGDDQLADLLASATLGVFPSRGEGFGLALVEALAAGVPIVASDIDAHREVLGPELAGSLVDFSSPAAAAAAIATLLDDQSERTRRSVLGRERSKAFDVDRLWAELQGLYRARGLSA